MYPETTCHTKITVMLVMHDHEMVMLVILPGDV